MYISVKSVGMWQSVWDGWEVIQNETVGSENHAENEWFEFSE